MWVVEALRWGTRENHSYVVGIYKTRTLAMKVAKAEEVWRGGKYICNITEFTLDEFNQEKMDYMSEC